MRQDGVVSLRERVYTLLQACLEKRDVAASREVYSLTIKVGLDSVTVLGDHLIHVFASCSSLPEALYVFAHIPNPSLYTWNSIISAHIRLGQDQRALALFQSMRILPDQVTFSNILKASINTRTATSGRCVHHQIVLLGFSLDAVVGSTLVDFYAHLGSLEEALKVFHAVPHDGDVVLWGTMIAAFVQHGHFHTSLVYLQHMRHQGIAPNKVIFLLALKACARRGDKAHGMLNHVEINKCGIERDTALQSALVDMYAKCGCLEDAQGVFERSDCLDLVLWSSMIGACIHCQKHQLAFEVYQRMLSTGFLPDKVVFLSLLQACGIIGDVLEGWRLHDEILMKGLDSDIAIENTLIGMYAKCADLDQAYKIFHQMQSRDAVSWAAIITGYMEHGNGFYALELFVNMRLEGFAPNKSVFSCVLKVCGDIGALEEGHLIHDNLIKLSLDNDQFIHNILVYMYSKCKCLKDAHNMFSHLSDKDIISWSLVISGYTEHGQAREALCLLEAMLLEGLEPDVGILLCSVSACGSIAVLHQGRCLHHLILSLGLDVDTRLASALLEMYVKCGTLQDAHTVFDCIVKPDVVLWSALVAGYCKYGQASIAVGLVKAMQESGMEPDEIAYLSLLRACGELGAVDEGRLLHSQIVGNQFDCNTTICSMLMDMYIKCGSMEDASFIFTRVADRDMVSWGAMVSGYALYGNNKLVMQSFEDIQQEGFKGSDGIFRGILNACSRTGLLKDGCNYFKSMIDDFNVVPEVEHYDNILDLLGRVGCINEAIDLLETIPNPPNELVYTSVLTGCRTYGNTKMATLSS